MLIISIMRLGSSPRVGATLVEVVVTTVLLVAFFAALFEVNAVCLRYIAAGKETTAAIAAVNDRAEVLRNLSFTDLTDASVVSALLAVPANTSDYCSRASEVVRLTAYPTADGTTQLSRRPDGKVDLDSSATSLGDSLVRVEVSSSWTAVFGGRARTERVATIISNGTKK